MPGIVGYKGVSRLLNFERFDHASPTKVPARLIAAPDARRHESAFSLPRSWHDMTFAAGTGKVLS
jgi:hypothetical protein